MTLNIQSNTSLITSTFGKGTQNSILNNFNTNSLSSTTSKTSSLVESLNKQKEQIQEIKEDLMASTKEKGGTMSDIKAQLEAFDDQIKELDSQIAKANIDDIIYKPTKTNDLNQQPKSDEDIQNSKIKHFISLSNSLEQAKSTDYIKKRLEGEANILTTEIKENATDNKLDRVNDIQAQIVQLEKQVMNILVNVNNQVEELNKESNTRSIENDNQDFSTKIDSQNKIAKDFSTTKEYYTFLKNTYSSIKDNNIKILDNILQEAMSDPKKESSLITFLSK
ncbi:MAG: hypothetical protein R3Y29_02310 [bacterium]